MEFTNEIQPALTALGSFSLHLARSLFHFCATILSFSFRSLVRSLYLSLALHLVRSMGEWRKRENAKNRIKREFKCFIKHVLYALQCERQCRKSPLNTCCWRTYFRVCRIFCIQKKKRRSKIETSVEKELLFVCSRPLISFIPSPLLISIFSVEHSGRVCVVCWSSSKIALVHLAQNETAKTEIELVFNRLMEGERDSERIKRSKEKWISDYKRTGRNGLYSVWHDSLFVLSSGCVRMPLS